MREAMEWLRRYEHFCSGSLDRRAAYAAQRCRSAEEGAMSLTLVRRIKVRPQSSSTRSPRGADELRGYDTH